LVAIVSSDFGLMFQVRNADDIAQYVRHCTMKGGALWGVDFPIDAKAVRYPLVVYLYNASRSGGAEQGVQAYGTVTRVTSGPSPSPPSNAALVPKHLAAESHPTWLHFEQILNVSPSVAYTEFYTVDRQRLTSVAPNTAIGLGPPYPVRK
jgi:hypothetical protein